MKKKNQQEEPNLSPKGPIESVARVPVEDIIRYEQGEMTEGEMIKMFQGLIDTGLVWNLQGHYGRTASQLIEAGYCSLRKNNS